MTPLDLPSVQGREKLRYSVRCTYLEIYREELTDLLRTGGPPLALRLDAARGAFVDGLEERDIFNSARCQWHHVLYCRCKVRGRPELPRHLSMFCSPAQSRPAGRKV